MSSNWKKELKTLGQEALIVVKTIENTESSQKKKIAEERLERERVYTHKREELSIFLSELLETEGVKELFEKGFFLPIAFSDLGCRGFGFGFCVSSATISYSCYVIDREGIGQQIMTPISPGEYGTYYPVRHDATLDDVTRGLFGGEYQTKHEVSNLRVFVFAHLKQMIHESKGIGRGSCYSIYKRKTEKEIAELKEEYPRRNR